MRSHSPAASFIGLVVTVGVVLFVNVQGVVSIPRSDAQSQTQNPQEIILEEELFTCPTKGFQTLPVAVRQGRRYKSLCGETNKDGSSLGPELPWAQKGP